MTEKIEKTDAEWQAQLSEEAYRVTRKHATERAGTHEDFPAGPGHFRCICCGEALFDKEMAEHEAFRAAHPLPAIPAALKGGA